MAPGANVYVYPCSRGVLMQCVYSSAGADHPRDTDRASGARARHSLGRASGRRSRGWGWRRWNRWRYGKRRRWRIRATGSRVCGANQRGPRCRCWLGRRAGLRVLRKPKGTQCAVQIILGGLYMPMSPFRRLAEREARPNFCYGPHQNLSAYLSAISLQ